MAVAEERPILITGGAGFIGSAVARTATARGDAVVILDALTYAACIDNLAGIADNRHYAFEKGDIRDRACLDRIFSTYRPRSVIHLAAESHVDRSIDAPSAFIDTNVTGTFQLLEAACAYRDQSHCPEGFRFLHVSTDEVFGSLGPKGQFDEATPYAPNSPYSASKAASDHLVRAWGETYGLPILVSNCSNNYGPYQFPEKLIPVVILAALSGQPIPIYGSGSNVRDWLFVDDHAVALLRILESGQSGRTYAIGGNAEVSNLELVHRICGLLDDRLPAGAPHARLITHVTDRPGHDARYAINATRIRDELGWRPSRNLEQGLALTIDWYLENRGWWQALQNRNGVGARLGLGA